MENDKEMSLFGGRTTVGVVRVGDTVRRPIHKNGVFIHEVLIFLEDTNFEYAPRFLGIDEQGREILTFIEGTVPDDLGIVNDTQLFDFMKIIRKLHDSSKGYTKSHSLVLCHGDLSPCNVVFQNGSPSAIIDWDSVYIGEPWEDLAYTCWLWINLGSHEPQPNAVEVIKRALDCYGADKNTRSNFSKKLLHRMDQALQVMNLSNGQYERTKKWVEESKKWVTDHLSDIDKI